MLTTSTAAAANQVTSTADSGAGSLRQAVADANGALVIINPIYIYEKFLILRQIFIRNNRDK